MKKFLMILMVLIFIVVGCAATKKQITEVSILSSAPALEAEKKSGLKIEQGCVSDLRDKEGRIFIKVRCKQERLVNIVVNLQPNTQHLILMGRLSFIRRSTSDGYIILENPTAEDIIVIPEMTDEEMKEIKPNAPVGLHFGIARDKPANALKNSADEGGE